MDPIINVRIAGRGDATLIAGMSRRTFYDSFAAQNTPEDMDHFLREQFSQAALEAEVGAPGNIFLLAYLDGQPAGYSRMSESEPPPELAKAPSIEIARIYSEQHAIGKGVGKALMQACLATARELGKSWIWLGVWEHNRRAIDFYTKWGFEKFGEHLFVVGFDPQTDWYMKKEL